MDGRGPNPDIVCVSYLACAQLQLVRQYPEANFGAEVLAIEQSVAADGAIVALMASAMGHESALVANSVGRDAAGSALVQHLAKNKVRYIAASVEGREASPQIAVVSDLAGSRTWFPYLPQVNKELQTVDFSVLARCRLAYIDYYDVIKTASKQAIAAAAQLHTPLFINLSGYKPASDVIKLLKTTNLSIVQTSVAEGKRNEAPALGRHLAQCTGARTVLVTVGAEGAIALSDGKVLSVPAIAINPRRFHAAGAAFSAGFATSWLDGAQVSEALAWATACGAYQCERSDQATWPDRAEIESFLRTHTS